MKKILLSLGSLVTIAAPVAAVVSCGDNITPADFPTPQIAPTVLDAPAQSTLKTSANSALGMNANDIDSVAKIENFTVYDNGSSKKLKNVVIYNVKKTVKSITINDAHGAAQHITTDGGGRIIIGVEAPTKRAAVAGIVISTRVVVEGKESNKFFKVTDLPTVTKIGKDVLTHVYKGEVNYYTVADLAGAYLGGVDLAGSAAEIAATAALLKDVIKPKLQTLTTTIFKTDIDASSLTAAHKEALKAFVQYYSSDAKLAYHILNFSASALDTDQLGAAQMAMADDPAKAHIPDDPSHPFAKKYQAADVISSGSTKVDDVIAGIVEKFAGEDDRFQTPFVQLSYKVNKAEHKLLGQIAASTADGAMGGIETLEYILAHGSTPWTIA